MSAPVQGAQDCVSDPPGGDRSQVSPGAGHLEGRQANGERRRVQTRLLSKAAGAGGAKLGAAGAARENAPRGAGLRHASERTQDWPRRTDKDCADSETGVHRRARLPSGKLHLCHTPGELTKTAVSLGKQVPAVRSGCPWGQAWKWSSGKCCPLPARPPGAQEPAGAQGGGGSRASQELWALGTGDPWG